METIVVVSVICVFVFLLVLEFFNRKREEKTYAKHLSMLRQKPLSELFEMVQAGSLGMHFHDLGWGSFSLIGSDVPGPIPVSKVGNTHVKIKNKRVPISTVSYGVPARFRFKSISENPFDLGDYFNKENDKKIPVVWVHYPNKSKEVYVLLNCTVEDIDGIFKATSSGTVLKG